MGAKTEQLQIRLTPQQKALLRRRARAAGLGVSTYVLTLVAPPEPDRWAAILHALESGAEDRYALAELNDFLTGCHPQALSEAVAEPPSSRLSAYLRNYVSAMVEQAAYLKGVTPPGWVRDVSPLDQPHFVTPLPSLRWHLLRSSPVPFKRRNIFVDSGIGDRV